ncbi:MAG TPA: NADH-quinone oxidoreductase subunit J [Pirellulales bacterium]|nr:NADH-quinone oxidoreductase subunit J [Pirellulales bacterium]
MMSLEALAGATVLLAIGAWLLLPRGRAQGRALGAVLAAVGVGLLGSLVVRYRHGHAFEEGVFLSLAITTIASALGAVTMRSPVYCAIWFALTLLGTAGLFLYQGAQFLGVATVVVYAGAILVMFLFVLMLAQPKGQTSYDRVSWEALLSASTGALLVGLLSTVLFAGRAASETAPAALVEDHATMEEREAEILAPEHMAHLGRQLFSRHLLAVEVAGTLLLVALVGAIAIVAQGKPATRRREEAPHG